MSAYNPEDLKGTARELAFDVERLEAALIKAELALRNQPPPTRVIELEATFDRIAVAMGCEPEDNDDLVEAVRLLVQERDAAVQRAKRAKHLHAEAEADLARLSVRLVDIESATVVGIVAWLRRTADVLDVPAYTSDVAMVRSVADNIESGAWRGKEAP